MRVIVHHRASMKQIGSILSAMLLALLIVRGVLPATRTMTSDFPNYYTAACIVRGHGDSSRLYDDVWFQQQIQYCGFAAGIAGKFSPFPPPTALLLLPLAGLAPMVAGWTLLTLSLLALAAAVPLLSGLLSWTWPESLAWILLSGYAVENTLRLGQPYLLVSLACVAGLYLYRQGWPLLSGLCLGVFVPIKYYPVVILLVLGVRREWRVLLGAAAAAGLVMLSSLALLGWQVHRQFLTTVLGRHLSAHLSQQDPFSTGFQSFDTLFRHLFVPDLIANPQPWIAVPPAAKIATVSVKLALLLVTVRVLLRLKGADPERAVNIAIGMLGVLVLLLAPATASYHAVLLWLPAGLLLTELRRQRCWPAACVLLGCYALMGFYPSRFTAPFEHAGLATVLAYPRLWLLLAMLLAGFSALRGPVRERPVMAA
jgi:hypothetical protein